jgi:hypothetical protein
LAVAARAVLMVTTEQERGYRAARHGLHPPPCRPRSRTSRRPTLGCTPHGYQPPFVTLRSRLPGFGAKELRTALGPGGSLIKLRTCRRTLHIYSLADAGVPHAATLRQRLGSCAATVHRLGQDPAVLPGSAPLIREALAAGPLPHRELHQRESWLRDPESGSDANCSTGWCTWPLSGCARRRRETGSHDRVLPLRTLLSTPPTRVWRVEPERHAGPGSLRQRRPR